VIIGGMKSIQVTTGAIALCAAVAAAVVTGVGMTTTAEAAATVQITPREYHDVYAVPAHTTGQSYSTKCPSGQLATGGGFFEWYFGTTLRIGSSVPSSDGPSPAKAAGWSVIVDNPDVQPRYLSVYVMCTPAK